MTFGLKPRRKARVRLSTAPAKRARVTSPTYRRRYAIRRNKRIRQARAGCYLRLTNRPYVPTRESGAAVSR